MSCFGFVRSLTIVSYAALLLVDNPVRADQKDPRLPVLFQRLHDTTNPQLARLTEFMIWQIWGESGKSDLDRLMKEGEVAMQKKDYSVALEKLSQVIAAQPDFAEGWNRRATLYFLTRDYAASLADIDHVLELEPRHFGAISGLGVVNMALSHDVAARDAFERVLSLYPLNLPAQENLKIVNERLDDRAI